MRDGETISDARFFFSIRLFEDRFKKNTIRTYP